MASASKRIRRPDSGSPMPMSNLIASVAWISLMNSVGALTILYLMIRRGEASKATNLFHVIPAVTQIMAALVLGEVPSVVVIVGFIVSGGGVYLMNHSRAK